MENIYEVERNEYKTFIGQLDPNKTDMVEIANGSGLTVRITSQKTGKILSERVNNNELETEQYFIYNYPDDDERIQPRPVMSIHLETREEVQDFFHAVAKLQKEHKND